jgi:hypothetical protein
MTKGALAVSKSARERLVENNNVSLSRPRMVVGGKF